MVVGDELEINVNVFNNLDFDINAPLNIMFDDSIIGILTSAQDNALSIEAGSSFVKTITF
jgi:hypothetical protein